MPLPCRYSLSLYLDDSWIGINRRNERYTWASSQPQEDIPLVEIINGDLIFEYEQGNPIRQQGCASLENGKFVGAQCTNSKKYLCERPGIP